MISLLKQQIRAGRAWHGLSEAFGLRLAALDGGKVFDFGEVHDVQRELS
jgi:hypothetical protein